MTVTQAQPVLFSSTRGRLVLILLCSIAFLDFVDGVIVNVALPSIRRDLDFTVEGLQWVPSGYLLTYGGFMLSGGRAADLVGRRRILIAGTCVFGIASLAGGIAGTADLLVGARIVQGIGAAMMLPAALSTLTTTYADGPDRHKAFGAWGAVAGLASAAGVLLGGLLTEGPGWRWVLLVNPPLCVLVLAAVLWLLPADAPAHRTSRLDVRGALLGTGGMLALVYAIVEAPDSGWTSAQTLITIAGAVALIVGFVINEWRSSDPILPLSLFRIRGLSAANATQLTGIAGFIAMFFFVTLYMQNVLGYSPIESGLAYLPVCLGVVISAAIASQLVTKVGPRLVIVLGA
ncbi:MAG: MFS transporter, partial [Actinomycetia bacterium]|nr:MFS transporter [Actinomycetes bacterium]